MANTKSNTKPNTRRQLAGEGAAADSILSGTDNAVGYGTEDALDNTAALISNTKGAVPAARRRQLDKISNGVQAVGNAAGVGSTTQPATSAGDSIDGTLTGDAAGAGAQVADTEVSTAEQIGSAVPRQRRQLDKISNGVQAVGDAAGVGSTTEPVTTTGDNVDGQLTGDAATVGQQVADDEVTTAEQAGSDVPTNA